MSFESGAASFRIFHMSRKLPDDALERFKENAAPSLDYLKEDPIFGWVTGRHLLDRKIDEDNAIYGGHLRLTLLKAEKKIPNSLLKAEQKQEELVRMQLSGNPFVSRKDRSDIKAELVDRLLPQMPPTLKGINMVYNRDGKFLFADALPVNSCDEFTIHFRHAVGMGPDPMTPEFAAMERMRVDTNHWSPSSFSPEVEDQYVSSSPGQDFLTWLWFVSETETTKLEIGDFGQVYVLIEGPLTFVMEGGGAHETVLRKGNPTVSAEAKACLLAGKKLSKCKISFVNDEDIWAGNIDADEFIFRTFKFPEDEEKLDPISRFEDRMNQVQNLTEMLLGCYDLFVGIRNDRDRWAKEQKAIHEWVVSRKSVN